MAAGYKDMLINRMAPAVVHSVRAAAVAARWADVAFILANSITG